MNGSKSGRFTRLRRRIDARRERQLAFQEEYFNKRLENPQDPESAKFPVPKRWIVFGITMFHVAMLVCYTVAYGIIRLICRQWFPDLGHPLGLQYMTVTLSLLLFGMLIMLVRIVFDPGRHQIHVFMLMLDAMRKMAKGDFDVTLHSDLRHMGQFGIIVKSFNRMATELSQMERMRQEFISNVSHEFQSPLTSIGGFARALQTDDLPPDTRLHYLHIIEMESARLSKLSDNLLKLTSLESKHHPFEPKIYRLDRQLRRVILSCEPQWQAKKLDLDVELPETAITADEDLLSQVWINLLHNAVKFTPDTGTVRIRLSQEDGRIRVEISDTGIGVSAHDLPHLFERFFKADKARSRSGGGSGLGLSIVKKIVDMHGGEVSASGSPGQGTSFTVVLPQEAAVPDSTPVPGRQSLQNES